jgi:Na+/proline symporter
MLGLHWLDWLAIGSYFALTSWIGLRAARAVSSSGDYFIGGRRFGRAYMIAHALGTGTSTEQPVTVAGATYQFGLAGIWYQWLYLFATPFYWLIAPIYRRLRYLTMGDFFERRYGAKMGAAYTGLGLFNFIVSIAMMLKGTAVTIEAVSGGAMPFTTTVFVLTAVFVAYSYAGGLTAAISNDLLQGVLIIALSVLLLPFAIDAAGGWGSIQHNVPDQVWAFIAPAEITLFFVVMVVINALVGVVVEPHHMAVCGAARNELASRTGWTYGNFIKRVLTLAWALTGVLAALLYPGLENRDQAFGTMVTQLLPVGLIGVMIACMAAAVISTCDAFMVGAGALYTRNIHARYVRKDLTDAAQLKVGRWSSLVIVALGVALALLLPSLITGLKLLWLSAAAFGIAFWSAIMWKRANRYGMAASLVVTISAMFITGDWGLDWSLPEQILLYLPTGFLTLIIVSSLTPAEPEPALRAFYTLLATPVGDEAKLAAAGIEVVDAGDQSARNLQGSVSAGVSQGLLVVGALSLHERFSFARYRVDLLGFGLAWLLVLGVFGLGLLVAWLGRG